MKRLGYFLLVLISIVFISSNFPAKDYVEIAKVQLKKNKSLVYRDRFVIVIDYSKSITSERLYVVDTKENKIILTSTVSHAWNSGSFYPTSFSNISGTNKSCMGAFVTKDEYNGSFGRSMVIKGLDKENSNAESRRIVFHSNEKMSTPWSKGCFATPTEANNKIISLSKGGCLVYVFN